MFLLIFESIGTSELILIGIIAPIFLGPRKLPQIAKTIGKTMADLRSTTNEFRSTWEREVDFEEEAAALRTGELPDSKAAPVARDNSILDAAAPGNAPKPAISGMSKEQFDAIASEKADAAAENRRPASDPEDLSDKRNWL